MPGLPLGWPAALGILSRAELQTMLGGTTQAGRSNHHAILSRAVHRCKQG